MKHVFKGSDVLTEMEYDSATEKLQVTFLKGTVYEYSNVSSKLVELFIAIENANGLLNEKFRVSIGRLFHYTIRIHPKVYPYKEI